MHKVSSTQQLPKNTSLQNLALDSALALLSCTTSFVFIRKISAVFLRNVENIKEVSSAHSTSTRRRNKYILFLQLCSQCLEIPSLICAVSVTAVSTVVTTPVLLVTLIQDLSGGSIL